MTDTLSMQMITKKLWLMNNMVLLLVKHNLLVIICMMCVIWCFKNNGASYNHGVLESMRYGILKMTHN